MRTSGSIWLRYPDVASAVDFVTIHILPYWEDFPIPAAQCGRACREHPQAGRRGIPEQGDPRSARSAGQAPAACAKARGRHRRTRRCVIEETLALAQRENFRVNVIEAFDQPWKRWLEGSVGGHWGIFRPRDRAAEIQPRGRREFPITRAGECRRLAGILLAAFIVRRSFHGRPQQTGAAVVVVEDRRAHVSSRRAVWLDHRDDPGGELHDGRLAAFARVRGRCGGRAHRMRDGMRAESAATDLRVIARAARRIARRAELDTRPHVYRGRSVLGAGGARSGVRSAYRDIPISRRSRRPSCLSWCCFSRRLGRSARAAMAERVAACVLAVSAIYIVLNESFANWQAVWFCAVLLCLAFILARARDAPD